MTTRPYNYPPIHDEDEFWACIRIFLGDCVIPGEDRDAKLASLEAQARSLLAFYRYLNERDLGIKTNPRKFSFHKR